MIKAKIIFSEDLTADALIAAIQEAADCPEIRADIPQEWFMGRDVLDKALIGLWA